MWLDIVWLVVQALVLALATTTAFAYLTYFERRVLARLQHRVGPNRAGPAGLLQPVADAVKLFFKEEVIPSAADRWVYMAAPAVAMIPAIIIWAVMPLGCWNVASSALACFVDPAQRPEAFRNLLQMADINVGILYLLAITSIGVYGITLAGWASNNKYSMMGGIRSAAQLISYELPLGLAVLAAVMVSSSLSTAEIVHRQAGLWTIVPQILGFVIFMISATAEVVRAPFDLVEAEQELVGGYNTEYGSMKFALFFMAEYIKLIAISAMAVMLYFGGWRFPGLQTLGSFVETNYGQLAAQLVVGLLSLGSFLLKVVAFLFFSVWMRASWPRVRYDQLMNLGWKWLLPLSLINIVITAVTIVLVPDRLIQSIILFVLGIVVLVGASLIGTPRRVRGDVTLVKQPNTMLRRETAAGQSSQGGGGS